MTSIIKNQLVKHLSKFARNLKPEQISLDVLKGKSELRNIELNEEVLTEVLELPIWLKIKKANCNRVAVRVPWTNLKSKPVELFIDEITVSIVLSADRSPSTSRKPFSDAQDTGSYGFAEKIVEGMSIYVNTLEINFDSGAFGGSFMLSRLSVESRTPGWALTNDLRKTRLHCHTTHRVLCYKQVSWQLLRIEASARTEETQRRNINAPLRLITSGGKIRICLKKNSQNGNVIHARISMLLDDILWVATLPQIRSAIAFYSHMMKLVNAAEKAAPSIPVPVPSKTQLIPSPEPQQIHAAANSMFRRLDLDQTSYHLQVKKIDLHLCDDNLNAGNYPKDWNIEAGAMQVTLHVLLIDVYPKTLASSDRSHWVRYTSPNSATSWMGNNLKHHFAKICEELDETTRMRVQRSWPDLMSFNVVVRVYDMVIQCVSDMRTKKEELQNMFTSDRNSKKSLPSDQYILHAEFANFFHPMTDHLPVPPPATFAQLGPFSLLFDKRTLRWILFVVENLQSAMIEADAPSMEPMPHTDIRIDLLMPKVIIHLSDPKLDARLPHRLIVSLSTVTACNNPFDVIPTGFSRIDTRLIDYVTNTELPEGKTAFRGDLLQMNNKQTVFGIAEGMQWWLRTSPLWIDTDHGEFSRTVPLISDVCFHASITTRKDQINVYVEPQTEVTALVDHFQFLQLTRLGAELSDFADLIKADQGFFQKGAPVNAPIIVVLVAINEVRAKLLLTSGPLPSPYETNQAFSQNNFADDLSECGRSVTPTCSPFPGKLNGDDKGTIPKSVSSQDVLATRAVYVEEFKFKEFPNDAGVDIELASNLDETMSIKTDLSDDDQSFVAVDLPPEEELFPSADEAIEACGVDDKIANDREYKSLMAKQVNVLTATLSDVHVLVNIFDQNMKILGKAEKFDLQQELGILRGNVYASKATRSNEPPIFAESPHAVFDLSAPSECQYSILKLNVNGIDLMLDDEIVAHLSAFIVDDQPTPNKVRLQVEVKDSRIEIRDPKKKKPLRLKIRECLIEQDED